MIGAGIILIGLSLAVPATTADPVDLSRLPGVVGLDYYYLSYLPTTIRFPPVVFWSVSLVAFALLTAVPWIFPVKKMAIAQVSLADCTGCTFCAADCPYTAISMVPRSDGRPYKQEAVVDPNLCVSCSICAGSCAWDAIGLAEWPGQLLQAEITETLKGAADLPHPLSLVFSCQRHVSHGAQAVIDNINRERGQSDDELRVISLPCVGMLAPTHISRALNTGAREVIVVGCPLEDCNTREGNVWLADELARRRPPYLRRKEHGQRVRTLWLPPNERNRLRSGLLNQLTLPPITGLNQARAFALLLVVFFVIALAADIPFRAFQPNEAMLQVGLRHSTQFVQQQKLSPQELAELPQHLQLEQVQGTGRFPLHLVIEMDGNTLLDQVYQPQGVRNDGTTFVLEKIEIEPGPHTLQVNVDDGGQNEFRTVIEETIEVGPGQVIVVGSDPVEEFVLYTE
jgi:coenzyme F420-reducing hydrogenase delta subunit/ferredoxin